MVEIDLLNDVVTRANRLILAIDQHDDCYHLKRPDINLSLFYSSDLMKIFVELKKIEDSYLVPQ